MLRILAKCILMTAVAGLTALFVLAPCAFAADGKAASNVKVNSPANTAPPAIVNVTVINQAPKAEDSTNSKIGVLQVAIGIIGVAVGLIAIFVMVLIAKGHFKNKSKRLHEELKDHIREAEEEKDRIKRIG